MTGAHKRLRGNDSFNHQDISPPAPVQSLPDDVLIEIFQVGVSMPKGVFETLPFQHVVSSVNRRWRGIAISTPRLWSTIFSCLGDPDCLSLWIERSASRALDITLMAQSVFDKSNIQLAIERLIPHVGRWRRLTIRDVVRSEVEAIIPSLRNVSAPQLQHFDLSVLPSYSGTHADIFTEGAPALTSVRITTRSQICVPPLTGLTSLHFGGICQESGSILMTYEELRYMLTASPFLADLTLKAVDLRSNASAADILLPSLRTLSLNFAYCGDSFVRILTLLSVPVLETLSVAQMTGNHMTTFETLAGTGLSRYTALRTLKLFMCGTPWGRSVEPPESFFSTFSSITHLYLISSAHSILEPSFHLVDRVHWPNLRAITMSPKASPGVVQSRISREHPLTTVYVPRDSQLSDETSWAHIREKIEVLEVEDVDSLQYPGGLDQDAVEGNDESDNDNDNDRYHQTFNDDYDGSDADRDRRAFYEQNYGVDYDDSDDSELLEYWAVCGSD